MREELKPCPFCGCPADGDHEDGCYFKASDAFKNDPCGDVDAPALLAAWNRRATAQDGAVLDGWKMVPVKPTVEMLFAWAESSRKHHCLSCAESYAAMLSVAPPPAKMRMLTEEEVDREAMRWNLPRDSAESFAFYKLPHAEQVMTAFKDGLKRGVELSGGIPLEGEQGGDRG